MLRGRKWKLVLVQRLWLQLKMAPAAEDFAVLQRMWVLQEQLVQGHRKLRQMSCLLLFQRVLQHF